MNSTDRLSFISAEIARLRELQTRIEEQAALGGLTEPELADYDARDARIGALMAFAKEIERNTRPEDRPHLFS